MGLSIRVVYESFIDPQAQECTGKAPVPGNQETAVRSSSGGLRTG